jgi:hypothetical protein
VLAALAVIAISLSAATITSTVTPSGGENGEGTPNDPIITPPEVDAEPGAEEGSDSSALIRRLFIVLGILALLGALAYTVQNPSRAAVFAVAFMILALGIYFLLEVVDNTQIEPGNLTQQQQMEEDNLSGSAGRGPSSEGENDQTRDLPIADALGFLLILALGIVLVARQFRLGSDDDVDEDETDSDEETAALGEIAGQAADRIEDGPRDAEPGAENEVYRAWEEMTAQLDIESGAATTPREFEQPGSRGGDVPRRRAGVDRPVRDGSVRW